MDFTTIKGINAQGTDVRVRTEECREATTTIKLIDVGGSVGKGEPHDARDRLTLIVDDVKDTSDGIDGVALILDDERFIQAGRGDPFSKSAFDPGTGVDGPGGLILTSGDGRVVADECFK